MLPSSEPFFADFGHGVPRDQADFFAVDVRGPDGGERVHQFALANRAGEVAREADFADALRVAAFAEGGQQHQQRFANLLVVFDGSAERFARARPGICSSSSTIW